MSGAPTGEYAGWDNLIGSMGMGGMGTPCNIWESHCPCCQTC